MLLWIQNSQPCPTGISNQYDLRCGAAFGSIVVFMRGASTPWGVRRRGRGGRLGEFTLSVNVVIPLHALTHATLLSSEAIKVSALMEMNRRGTSES